MDHTLDKPAPGNSAHQEDHLDHRNDDPVSEMHKIACSQRVWKVRVGSHHVFREHRADIYRIEAQSTLPETGDRHREHRDEPGHNRLPESIP